MSRVWEIRTNVRKTSGEWTKHPFTLVQVAKRDAASGHTFVFNNSDDRDGLWCEVCRLAYCLPHCDCGQLAYRAVLIDQEGAGLSCTECENLVVAWACPGCGAHSRLNESMATFFVPPIAAGRPASSPTRSPIVLLVLGAILLLAGAVGFLERGFFADKVLGASVMGNMPWDRPGAVKVQKVATGAGVIAATGALLALAGAVGVARRQPVETSTGGGSAAATPAANPPPPQSRSKA